ncbi:MAG: nucleoside triphosphate pyrophosphohydrolase family protein [Candidatus Thorarchaeota archaeon]|jgi:NTP pyrophosphatase (non-canonical NTP hydrolase)
MNFYEYQELAERTVNKALKGKDRLSMTALGLTGESGEVADMIKKSLYHGHPLDRERLTKEIGDVLWYISVMAETLGIPLEKIAEQNIAKLAARYPEGFSEYLSINRKD